MHLARFEHASKYNRLLNPETKQIVTFLDKSFQNWANVKDLVIVSLTTEIINTIGEYFEVDAPNLISPDHGPDDKCMIDDDDTCQGDDLQIPVPSILKHGN